ncbi:hypothetical protein DFH27DRAFT_598981 [Peziza echinospora]|nr:hypothetical protein DFH27DRAFT_598981 [Peziza echinospora]
MALEWATTNSPRLTNFDRVPALSRTWRYPNESYNFGDIQESLRSLELEERPNRQRAPWAKVLINLDKNVIPRFEIFEMYSRQKKEEEWKFFESDWMSEMMGVRINGPWASESRPDQCPLKLWWCRWQFDETSGMEEFRCRLCGINYPYNRLELHLNDNTHGEYCVRTVGTAQKSELAFIQLRAELYRSQDHITVQDTLNKIMKKTQHVKDRKIEQEMLEYPYERWVRAVTRIAELEESGDRGSQLTIKALETSWLFVDAEIFR